MLGELNTIRDEFRSLPDAFSRYSYLLALSELLPSDAPGLHADENRYRGCQSAVWLLPAVEDGAVKLYADSDSVLLRGLLYVYGAVLGGETPARARKARFDLVTELGIGEHFDTERAVGLAGALAEIQRRLPADETGDEDA